MFVATLAWMVTGTAWAGDKDKDGVSNKEDACKEVPEDMDGFEDEDGCPDPDNDGDGLEDGDDKCPSDAEDKDGFQDDDGCPDTDNDGDGVLDAADQCEGEDGTGTANGCPVVTFDLLSNDGWVGAIKDLNEGLMGALQKEAEGCPDAKRKAESWMMSNNPDLLLAVFNARKARAPEDADSALIDSLLTAQASVWDSAKPAFDIYCKDTENWSRLSQQLDGVYKRAKPPLERQ